MYNYFILIYIYVYMHGTPSHLFLACETKMKRFCLEPLLELWPEARASFLAGGSVIQL